MSFKFGVYELFPETGELRKYGSLLKISPQAFLVLTVLLESAGQIVTRDELSARLWGDAGTSVEFDAGLNRCVRQVRAINRGRSSADHSWRWVRGCAFQTR